MSADERREQIVESAHRVFTRSGLAGARTRDIAEEAGINEALVYQHFRSKDELFDAVIAAALTEAGALLATDIGRLPPARQHDADEVKELMVRQVDRLLRAFVQIEPLLGVVLYGEDEVARRHFDDFLRPYLDQTRQVLVDFLPYWAHGSFDPERAVEALLGMVWTRVLIARVTSTPLDLEVEAHALAEMVLDGLLAR